jgi:hypothetical protein
MHGHVNVKLVYCCRVGRLVRETAKNDYWLRHVCPSVITRLPQDRYLLNLIFEYFFENLSWKFKFRESLVQLTCTVHDDQCTFSIISRSFILRIRNVSDESCRENQNTHFTFGNLFFPENRTFYEIMWKNIVQPDRQPQMTIWRMRIACWIPKATNTHSQHVVLIAFPLQQWLRERASVLRHTYIACLVLTFS